MKCKYDKCDNDAKDGSLYCCASHRAQQSRRNSATSKAQHAGATFDKHITELAQPMANKAQRILDSHPPCTPDQLTSSCLACKDKPTCSYLHNMNSAVPGDADYARVI